MVTRQKHMTTFYSNVSFHSNQIRSLLKTHFVKTKNIKIRRDIDEFLSRDPEHLET